MAHAVHNTILRPQNIQLNEVNGPMHGKKSQSLATVVTCNAQMYNMLVMCKIPLYQTMQIESRLLNSLYA